VHSSLAAKETARRVWKDLKSKRMENNVR
jgi:hypothetical protein